MPKSRKQPKPEIEQPETEDETQDETETQNQEQQEPEQKYNTQPLTATITEAIPGNKNDSILRTFFDLLNHHCNEPTLTIDETGISFTATDELMAHISRFKLPATSLSNYDTIGGSFTAKIQSKKILSALSKLSANSSTTLTITPTETTISIITTTTQYDISIPNIFVPDFNELEANFSDLNSSFKASEQAGTIPTTPITEELIDSAETLCNLTNSPFDLTVTTFPKPLIRITTGIPTETTAEAVILEPTITTQSPITSESQQQPQPQSQPQSQHIPETFRHRYSQELFKKLIYPQKYGTGKLSIRPGDGIMQLTFTIPIPQKEDEAVTLTTFLAPMVE